MKKLISFLMVCLLLAGMCSASAVEFSIANNTYLIGDFSHSNNYSLVGILGDADMSGIINVKDATYIQKSVASLVELSDDEKALSDTDLSSDITVRDATTLQKWIAGFTLSDNYTGKEVYKENTSDVPTPDTEPDNEPDTLPSPQNSITGTWENTTEAAETVNALIEYYAYNPTGQEYIHEVIPGFTDYHLITENFNIESCIVKTICTFNEDGTYVITVDEDVLEQTITTVKADVTKDAYSFLKAYAKEKKLPLPPNLIVKLFGYDSVEAFVEEKFPVDKIYKRTAPKEGTYHTEAGRLYLDEYDDSYANYTVDGDTMTITSADISFISITNKDIPTDIIDTMYPMDFTRVK